MQGATHDRPRTAPARLESRDGSRPRYDTVVAALEEAARAGVEPFTLHVRREPERLTARALLEGARRFAAALRRAGVRSGDRVPILLPTSADFIHALLGSMLAGAAPVPLASPMTFGSVQRYLDNLAAVVVDADARVLVTTLRMRDAIRESVPLRTTLLRVLTTDALPSRVPSDPRSPSIDAKHTALIQYTSGTTGRPKGVVISHGALTANAHAIHQGLELGDRDVGASWLPLFHDMGLIGVLLTGVCHPYSVHLMRPEDFVMRPVRWLRLLSRTRATVSAAPNFAYELCVSRAGELAGLGLQDWRRALNGAEPVHAATVRRFTERFAPDGFRPDAMMPVYGLAEATLAVSFPRVSERIATVRAQGTEVVSCGRPVARTSVRVTREGAVATEGEVGEIEIRGPSVMDGYFRNQAATEEALRDGWLRTGDLGLVRDGRLFVAGRARDLVIKGGRNVHPHDVERVAATVAGVSGAVAAFGRPNERTGTEDLVVVAEARNPDRERLAREITGDVLATLGVKVDEVHVWPIGAVPRTTSGKVRRDGCRRLLAEGGLR